LTHRPYTPHPDDLLDDTLSPEIAKLADDILGPTVESIEEAMLHGDPRFRDRPPVLGLSLSGIVTDEAHVIRDAADAIYRLIVEQLRDGVTGPSPRTWTVTTADIATDDVDAAIVRTDPRYRTPSGGW
jgi:hypothetical protein